MKKILAMLLALACVLSFAACASKKTDDTIGEEKPSTSEQMPTEPEAPAEEPDAPAEKPQTMKMQPSRMTACSTMNLA